MELSVIVEPNIDVLDNTGPDIRQCTVSQYIGGCDEIARNIPYAVVWGIWSFVLLRRRLRSYSAW